MFFQTVVYAQMYSQHACVTQASPGPQKQRDLQAEPSRFTTLPVLCKAQYINSSKTKLRMSELKTQ
jgi:hypothetical protein